MHTLKTCTCCSRKLTEDKFYKKGNRLDSRCMDCSKKIKSDRRKFKKLSKAGNAKRICSLKVIKKTTLEHKNTKDQVHHSLIGLFKNNSFELGVKI